MTALPIYSVHITDWSTDGAFVTGDNRSQWVTIAQFTDGCGDGSSFCIPQEGVSNELECRDGSLNYRLAYWNDNPESVGAMQHWLVNLDAQSSTGQVAIRWMEFTTPTVAEPVTQLAVYQQGTYAGNPPDTYYRWMGSIARDNVGDILVGYSKSSSSIYPSIAVAGRVSTDALGTLSPEVLVVNGTGAQYYYDRWGDYSTMAIDPSDNCTFFFTTEYYMVTASLDWSTNISSWKFPNCR